MRRTEPPRCGLVRLTAPVLMLTVAGLAGCTADTPAAPASSGSGSAGASAATTAPPTKRASLPTSTRRAGPPATTPTSTPHSTISAAPSATGSAAAAATLDVTVTFSQWNASAQTVDVGGYTAAVIDSDGVCTLTLTSGADTVRQSVTGVADVSSTSCGTVSVGRAQLHRGMWTGRLAYTSHSGSGTSAPVSIEVP